jgi:predicted nucleotidyltransferase
MPARHRPPAARETKPRYYTGADVPMAAIRRYARQVAERFRPEKIILFGSYAYGTPHADSDVDLLVVMPARNQLDQVVRIRRALPASFPLDLIVRTPRNLKWRLEEGESFHTEIVTRGRVLHEKGDAGVGPEGGGRPSGGRATRRRSRAVT